MSDYSSPQKSLRSRSSATMIKYYPRIGRRRMLPGIPKAAHWGWGHLPLPAKIMVAGVLCGVISLTTPCWAYIKALEFGQSTFGLWHFCSNDVCTSIHDNLIEGRSVQAWFHLTQGSMCIGVACSIISLAMLTNSIEGRKLRMTATVHTAVSCVLAISALEHFLALSIFANYLDNCGFLFTTYGPNRIDFHGSYYLGVVSLACSLASAFVVYLNGDAFGPGGRRRKSRELDLANPEHLKLLREFWECQQDGHFRGPVGDPETDSPWPHVDDEEASLGYDGPQDEERAARAGWYGSPPNAIS